MRIKITFDVKNHDIVSDRLLTELDLSSEIFLADDIIEISDRYLESIQNILSDIDFIVEKPDILNNKEDYNKLLEILDKYSNEDIAMVIAYGKMLKDSVEIANELNLLNAGLKNVK